MMDPFQGIVVHVISNGQILDFYDDPDETTPDNDRTRQHYVEAVTGASFSVRVLLTTEYMFYDLEPTDAVQVTMRPDRQNVYKNKYLERRKVESILLGGKPGEYNFTGQKYFCPRTEQWMQSDYAFGKLEPSKLHSLLRSLKRP